MAYLEQIRTTLSQYTYFGNSVWDYVFTAGVFVVLMIVLKIFQSIILRKLEKIAKRSVNHFDDALVEAIGKLGGLFYFSVSLLISIQYLTLPEWLNKTLSVLLVIAFVYEFTKALGRLLKFFMNKFVEMRIEDESEIVHANATMRVFRGIIIAVVWLIAALLILSNLGINVMSLVASLGIGGIAVAFALQNILADVFSSFSIFIDKPFQVGDFIVVGENAGTVKQIGLKSTRIKTLRGEELVFPNQELTSAKVQNFRQLERRRDEFHLGVTYETPKEKLEKIPALIEEAVSGIENAKFSRAHFHTYGDFSLIYEVVYFIDDSSYETYMDIRQEINMNLFELFKKEDIDFAYPTQQLYVSKS